MLFEYYFIAIAFFLSFFISANSLAQSCEEDRTTLLQQLQSSCGPGTVCTPVNAGQTCRVYDPLILERFNSPSAGYKVSCHFTSQYIDPDPAHNDEPQEYTLVLGYVLDCAGFQPPLSSSGPAGVGTGGGSGGGPCKGQCCRQDLAVGPPGSIKKSGSIVSVETQALGELVSVVGANFSMYYYSAFQSGRVVDFNIVVPISGAIPRDYITGFFVENRRGGVLIDSASFANTLINQNYIYAWNGLDPSNIASADSAKFGLIIKENSPSGSFSMPYEIILSHWNAKSLGLGGWLPTGLYHYDVLAKRLYSSMGDYRNVEAAAYGASQLFLASENGREVYIFDSNGNHLSTKTGLLGTTILTIAYDPSGRLASIAEPFGKVTTFNRDLSGDITSITAPNGQVTSIGLDVNGYVSTITNPNSETYSITYYGTQGLMHTFQKPNGEVSTFEYTADGLLTKDSHSGGYFFELVKAVNSNVTYDITLTTTMGRASSVRTNVGSDGSVAQTQTSPSGATYTSNFTVSGASYTRSDSGGGYTTNIYSSVDPRFGSMSKAATQYDFYPSGGNSRIVTSTDSVVLSDPADPFSISSMSNVKQLSGANTTVTRSFNPSSKKFTSTTYLGKTSEIGFDSFERTISTKVGSLNFMGFGYTNEKLTSISQGTRTSGISYNSLGLVQSYTDPLLNVTSYIYDSANRVTSRVLPDSRVIGFSYDAAGNLIGVTPPSRPLHSFVLNGHGLPSAYEPPVLSGMSVVNTTYTYNSDKQIISLNRPSGQYILFNYNATSGIMESMETLAGIYPISRDSATGLPTYIETPAGITMNLGYVGRSLSNVYTYVSGTSAGSYVPTYGSYNHIVSDTVTSGGSGATTSSIAFLYNDDEDLSKAGDVVLTYNTPNGQLTGTTMGSGATGFTDTYTYNTYGEVTGYQAKRGTAIIYDMTLGRDGSGRINSKSQTMNSTTNAFAYVFDSSGRLTQVSKNAAVVSNYGYDSNSNRSSGNIGSQATAATYDDQDRLLTYNTLSFTYDANGDLATKTNSATSQTTTYTYDVFGNLTQVVLPGGATTITYEIDGLNRRIGKKVNGVVQKRWVYMDQYRIAAELNSSGTITKRFIYGSKGNIPDYMIASGVKYRIVSDNLGSPRLVVKQSDGTILQRMDHDEFGRVTEDTNPGYLPFGFAGGLYDNQTGIVRFGARDYDPETGRWTSKDPIMFKGDDSNLFGYVAQDPSNVIDPSGLYAICTRPLRNLPGEIGDAYHMYICAGGACGGQGPVSGGSVFGSNGADDSGGARICYNIPSHKCVDDCINKKVTSPDRTYYDIFNRDNGVNCQMWANTIINECTTKCSQK